MKILTSLILVFTFFCVNAQKNFPYKLTKVFETSGFETPESVIKDTKNNVLYVSNINGEAGKKDGNGYISKISPKGEIIEKKWITGLNAPKGLAIYKNNLYLADIDEVVRVDINTGKKKVFKAPGATFLNDVAVSKKGDVYISNTFGFGGIYKLSGNKISIWLKGMETNPNGLIVKNNELYVVTWGTKPDPNTFATKTLGKFIKINLKTKKITEIISSLGNLDGLTETLHGYMISDWMEGKLIYYDKKNYYNALDLPKGSADISFDKENKQILVPQMLNGTIAGYRLSK